MRLKEWFNVKMSRVFERVCLYVYKYECHLRFCTKDEILRYNYKETLLKLEL